MMETHGHSTFNTYSLQFVDQIMILRINTEESEIEVLLNAPVAEAMALMSSDNGGKRTIPHSKLIKPPKVDHVIEAMNEVCFRGYIIRELETGTIELEKDGVHLKPVKPVLRELAVELNIALLNNNGNPLNTRQLGTQIIKSVKHLGSSKSDNIQSSPYR